MLQLSLFPSREMTRPRLPKAVVARADVVRTATRRRREVRYWRLMERVILLDRVSVPAECSGQKYYVPTRGRVRRLTPDEVRAIRTSPLKPRELAIQYGRSQNAIYDILSGESYKDAT